MQLRGSNYGTRNLLLDVFVSYCIYYMRMFYYLYTLIHSVPFPSSNPGSSILILRIFMSEISGSVVARKLVHWYVQSVLKPELIDGGR